MSNLKNFCELGGHGVDIKLNNMGNHGGRVWWSPRSNSYVMVADPEEGDYQTEDGTRVTLYSINGIGEIRWEVSAWCPDHEGEAAVAAFGLKKAERLWAP